MDNIDNTTDTLIQELKRPKKLKLESTSMDKTKVDIDIFKLGLSMLSDEEVPTDHKKQIAVQIVNTQNAIKRLKNHVDELDYMIFYERNIQDQTLRSIAAKHGIDEKTVKRSLDRCLTKLSIFLHPDLSISEILYWKDGWSYE